ncbi:MAG TPA: 30S ribosomal protein S3 [Candidatus Saccharimonadia bacterium]|jgi:small subunit ribosomal protein S3
MGQKVNPRSMRLQVDHDWQSRWYADRDYATQLIQDLSIRKAIAGKLSKRAGVARVDIERSPGQVVVTIHTSKPGVVIGRGGSGAEELKSMLSKITGGPIKVSIEEVKKPETNATLVAENVAGQLERRISFRRAMKMSVENAMKNGAQGAKVAIAGRLNGAEMARRESVSQGSIPLHTLRADIDFAHALARTTYGVIGVKVWVYKGTKFEEKK